MARFSILVLADVAVSLPAFLVACWAAFANPFVGEKVGMIVAAVSALLVMLPSVLLLCHRSLWLAAAWILSLLYGLMLLVGAWILLYDFAYGTWWWQLIVAACLGTIAKSIFIAFKLTKHAA